MAEKSSSLDHESREPAVDDQFTSRRSGLKWWVWLILAVVIVAPQWRTWRRIASEVSGYKLPEAKIAWRETYKAALVESKETSKPLLLVFSATWCGPCQAMKHEVWPDEQVSEMADSKFVPVYVDVDSNEGQELSALYGVRSIPSIFVTDSDGKVLRQGHYMSSSELVGFLSSK